MIQRDGQRCLCCGMTRRKHRKEFGRDITVDHIDGRSDDKSNLATLCLRCHGKKDRVRRGNAPASFGETQWQHKLTNEKVLELRSLRESGLSYRTLGRIFGVSASTAHDAVHKSWRRV